MVNGDRVMVQIGRFGLNRGRQGDFGGGGQKSGTSRLATDTQMRPTYTSKQVNTALLDKNSIKAEVMFTGV